MSIRSDRITNASELGEFTYCQRSWWLSHIKGLPATNQAVLARGQLLHEAHGRHARLAARLRQLAVFGLLLAVTLTIVSLCLLTALAGGGR